MHKPGLPVLFCVALVSRDTPAAEVLWASQFGNPCVAWPLPWESWCTAGHEGSEKSCGKGRMGGCLPTSFSRPPLPLLVSLLCLEGSGHRQVCCVWTSASDYVPAQAISLGQICYLGFSLPVKGSTDPTPPLQGVVPIPTTKNHPRGSVGDAFSRSWLFGCKSVLPWSGSSLGPQQCPCQPSSRGGAPIITEGSEHVLESRSGGN